MSSSAGSAAGGAPATKGPPYLPTVAGVGGSPTKSLDDPICSVFLVLFVIGAVFHMAIFQVNIRRKKKFVISAMIFGFCMARIVTMTMRLVWASHPTNISVAIAAQVFVSAGVLLLFIVNLIFAQRIVRASHPHWAWAKWFSIAFKLYYVTIVIMLAALITCTVQSFYTLSKNTHRIDRDVQLVGATYFAVAAFLPIPLMLLRIVIPDRPPIEKFGHGRFRSKILILVFSSVLLTLGAAFRAGIAYVPRPRADPAWYDSKPAFYLFNFTIEIIVVGLYAIVRIDKRFHIPDGSHGPGDYIGISKPGVARRSSFADRVLDEETVFGDGSADALGKRRGNFETHEITTFTPPRSSYKEVEASMHSPLSTELTPPNSAPSFSHENKQAAEPVRPLPTIQSNNKPTTHEEEKSTTFDEEKITAGDPEESIPGRAL